MLRIEQLPMKPSEIRDELLGQHAGLRAHLESVRLAAERWSRGELSRAELQGKLADFADALGIHNRREETASSELIRSIGARSPARDGFMDDEHVSEHREMFDALNRVTRAQDPGEGGRDLENFCERMLAHMTWEERAFLNATVLPDEGP
jgi:hypothetical protein